MKRSSASFRTIVPGISLPNAQPQAMRVGGFDDTVNTICRSLRRWKRAGTDMRVSNILPSGFLSTHKPKVEEQASRVDRPRETSSTTPEAAQIKV